MPAAEITENHAKLANGRGLFYLSAGPEDGPLLIFVHGWPELSISWRNQLPVLGGLGFRALALDMPGYGRSVIYPDMEDYRLENIVADMMAFLDSLGAKSAVWIGHDWGSPVVWSIASHHPDRCEAVASLCIPYRAAEMGVDHAISTVDRSIYPEARYPNGPWEYHKYYEKDFDRANRILDADPENVLKMFFTRGDASGAGKPAYTATVTRDRGWFNGQLQPPESPLDEAILSEVELRQYASALRRNGFFGPNAWYMNHARNAEYTTRAVNDGVLDLPALFLLAEHDHVCESIDSRLAEGMRRHCRNLTSVSISSGHWMAQECPAQVNAAIARWLAVEAQVWPALREPAWRPLP